AALSGCVTRAPLDEQYEGPRALPPRIAEQYLYEPAVLPQEVDAARQRRSFVVREVTLPPAAQGDGTIEFEYYDLDGSQSTPVVVLLPILNGNLWISRYFARYFTDHGWATLVVDRDRDP